jgi:hypothetical protein
MPKLRLAILPVIFAWAGFSQSVTATQIHPTQSSPIIHQSSFVNHTYAVSLLVKKCTIKRYRRPH